MTKNHDSINTQSQRGHSLSLSLIVSASLFCSKPNPRVRAWNLERKRGRLHRSLPSSRCTRTQPSPLPSPPKAYSLPNTPSSASSVSPPPPPSLFSPFFLGTISSFSNFTFNLVCFSNFLKLLSSLKLVFLV